jgi:hypothetical protein
MLRFPMLPLRLAVLLLCAAPPLTASAVPIVWSGPVIVFSKASGADWTLAANQDRITDNVVITRASTQGIFNIALETAFSPTSPSDTEWATDLNNPSQAIRADNYAALAFSTWQAAYDNSPMRNAVGRSAVLHLIRDDIYLELRFTGFQGGTPGGAFAYERSTAVPEPGALALGALALVGLAAARGAGPRFACPGTRSRPRLSRCGSSRAGSPFH